MKLKMMQAYLKITNKFRSAVASLKNEEDGMETVQAIILIVVGVVIVGALIALAKNKLLPAVESSIDDILSS